MGIDSRVAKNAEKVYSMLREGKKVTTNSERNIRYFEDWNDPNSGTSSSTKTCFTDILYFWANPQMNRIMGMLADGRKKDIKIDLLDIHSFTFTEYIQDPKPNGWRHVFDAKKMFPEPWYKCRELAKQMKYDYICFNSVVYATRDEQQAFPICTEEEL